MAAKRQIVWPKCQYGSRGELRSAYFEPIALFFQPYTAVSTQRAYCQDQVYPGWHGRVVPGGAWPGSTQGGMSYQYQIQYQIQYGARVLRQGPCRALLQD